MDLRKELERGHSITLTRKLVNYVGNDPAKFSHLIEIFLEGPFRITQRAAWPLTYCVEQHPALIKPHLKQILRHLKKPGIHDAVRRNTMRLLQFVDIPPSVEGHVAQICFEYLANRKQPIAVRVFSMAALDKISDRNPELKNELRILIEDELPYASAAFRSRAKKVLKAVENQST